MSKKHTKGEEKLSSDNGPIDPYTGEPEPLAEDADKIVEITPVDSGKRKGKDYLLNEENAMDFIAADENADAVSQKTARYTQDREIRQDFTDRQNLGFGGRKVLETQMDEYHAESPETSAGDLDANWQDTDVSGEEAVGGMNPTPDQDVVGEIGEALGLTYEDDEPLASEEKLEKRDRDRWELDPDSMDE
jgi:hypothetical protein